MTTKKLKQQLQASRKPAEPKREFVPTGSTLLNLGISGKPFRGFITGRYVLFVGDSETGKTFFCMTCFAEAVRRAQFDKYRLILNDVEGGVLMNIKEFFGKNVADRLETRYPSTTEELFDLLHDDKEDGRPFIQVVDSLDALDTEAAEETFKQQKLDRRKGREITGSYGDAAKAKQLSGKLRGVMSFLKKSGSILIVIAQTRDNLGFGARFQPKSRSGGRAAKFYASTELWSSTVGKIKKKVRGREMKVGMHVKIDIQKNRISGKHRAVVVPFLDGYGIDDIGSCVDFLVENKHWKIKAGEIRSDLGFRGTREALIEYIEKEGLQKDLISSTAQVWNEIEDELAAKRKPRYA